MRSLFEGLLAAQSHFISTGSSVESLQQVLAACARRLPLSGAAVFALDGSAPLTLANLGEARGLEAHALGSEAPDIVVLRCLEVEVVVASLVLSGPGLADAASQLAPALPVIARLAQARHRGEQHRRDIVNAVGAVGAVVDGGFDWDIITGVVTYSPSFLEMLGLEAPGPHITEWSKLVHPEDLRRQEAAIEAHYFGRAELYQAEYRCKNARTGEWVWLEVRGRIVERRLDGTPVKLVGSHTDITSRKALDARFARTDRLASLGTMAAGMAHEINNPLAFMQSNLEFVRRGLSEPLNEATLKELDIALEDTLEGTARIGRIVRDLRVFSTPSREERKPVQLSAVVGAAQRLVGALLSKGARVVVEVPEALVVLGDENELVQVVVNLLVNAAHAVRGKPGAQHEVKVTAHAAAPLVRLEVSDTGPGIANEHLKHVFDPFFTTKPIGEGTGLGLAICHSLVTAHGGDITIANRDGGGCQVVVRLPASTWRSMDTPPPAEVSRAKAPRVRVLVVDDEPLMRTALLRGLSADHDVALAADGAEALQMMQRDPKWEVVLCDVVMRHMNGIELFERVQQTVPDLAPRMVFLTGGAWDAELRRRLEALPNERLEKPISLLALREVIRRRRSPLPSGGEGQGGAESIDARSRGE